MNTLTNFINTLTAQGEIAFTSAQASKAIGGSVKAVECAIYRLKRKGEIASPAKGYYLILTPEFRKLGCLPPDYFIDQLMQHWQQAYYVGCLSAAFYLGAAHQQPQVLQVIVDQYRKNIVCGQVRIEFILKRNFSESSIQKIKTRTGFMQISSPETTFFDLIIYMKRNGGINQTFTVISELIETIDVNKFKSLLTKNIDNSYLQRAGYLLELSGNQILATLIYEHLNTKHMNTVPLAPYYSMKGSPRNKKWKIAINVNVESDIDDTY